jgi:hypothetical protein
MFIIGAALSAVTGYFETNPNGFIRATGPEWDLSPVQRVLLASRAVWFYLAKLFLPIHLSFNYPRIVPDPSNAAQCCYFVATVVVLVYLFVARGRLGRGPLVAAVCYLAALFPAMGFVNTYPFRVSFVWDHFQYLAGIPLIAAVICGIAPFFARQRRFGSRAPGVALALPVGLAACLLLVTTVASRARAYVFVDNGQLWQDTLAKNPHSWFAAYNLAGIRITSAGDSIDEAARLSQGGDQDSSQASAADAVAQLNQAQQLLEDVIANSSAPPDLIYQSYTQLAVVEITRRRLPGADVTALMRTAEEYLQNAIADEQKIHVSDRDPLPYYDMGLVKMNQAQFLEQQPQAGAATQPAIPPTTRPATPAEQRVLDLYAQAQDYFLRALEAAKNSLYAINNWGQARQLFEISARQRGNIDWHLAALAHQRGDRTKSASYTSEALADYQGSFFMNPDNIETNYQLALCLEWFGHFDEAQWHLRRIVIKLNPYFAPAYNEIGLMLLQNPHPTMDDLQTAIQCFKDALNLDKNLTDAASNLQKATALLASARPVTRPSTAPAATRP